MDLPASLSLKNRLLSNCSAVQAIHGAPLTIQKSAMEYLGQLGRKSREKVWNSGSLERSEQ